MSEDKPQDGLAGRMPSQGGLWSETETWRPTGEVYEAPLWPRRIELTPTASAVSLKRQGRAFQILDRLRQGPARTWDLMMLGGAGFSSRIRELRVSGFQIECTQDEDGAVYRLASEGLAR